MICSVPSSGGKSTSGWLARLRSSKGFSSGTDVDLDHFLANHNNRKDEQNDSVSPKAVIPQRETASSRSDPTDVPNASQGKHVRINIVENVLAQLFVMGDDNGFPKLKSSRKQPNPRFCGSLNSPAFSCINNSYNNSDDAAVGLSNDHPPGRKEGASASPVSNDDNRAGRVGLVKLVENINSGEEEEDGKGQNWNLVGFSRTEVTVIDTSFAKWKFEKLLFRKKNVWKARDKKGKAANITKKKRRKLTTSVVDDDDNVCGGHLKKAKVLDGQFGFTGKGNGGGTSKEEYNQSNASQTTNTLTSDNFGKYVKKKKASLNLEKGGSSVFLIKSIPANKKGGTNNPKHCTKSTQKPLKV